MADYFELEGLQDLYLEDSFIVSIAQEGGSLSFGLQAVLTERHPLWQVPRPGERYCYLDVELRFAAHSRIEWLEENVQPTTDLDGSVDYGNIEAFVWQPGLYELTGDGWQVRVHADQAPTVVVIDPPPAVAPVSR